MLQGILTLNTKIVNNCAFTFKIYKNNLNLFINEPIGLNSTLSINTINLNFDLGSFIAKSIDKCNFYISRDLKGILAKIFFFYKLNNTKFIFQD